MPFDLDATTLGSKFKVAHCPSKLPHDVEKGCLIAQWFCNPYHAWYVGTVLEVNKARTVSENITAEFHDETYGTTVSHLVADKDTYGCDKLWVLLTACDDVGSDTEAHVSEDDSASTPITSKAGSLLSGSQPSSQASEAATPASSYEQRSCLPRGGHARISLPRNRASHSMSRHSLHRFLWTGTGLE